MKTISFSAIEILPTLLSKKKCQTIKPAKYTREEHLIRCPVCYAFETKRLEGHPIRCSQELGTSGQVCCKQGSWDRPPRFKVRDQVRLYWMQRSKYQWFTEKTGNCLTDYRGDISKICFNKLLGTAEITEVFKIEMNKITENYSDSYFIRTKKEVNRERIAKLDGFHSAEQMFKWFDKKYDLSQPKQFWVYKWKWLK